MPLLLPHYFRRRRAKLEESLTRDEINNLLVHSKKLYSFEPKEGINGSLWHRVVQEKCLNFSKKMKLVASQKHNWNFSLTSLKNITVLDLSIDIQLEKVSLAFLKSMINLEILRLHVENNNSLFHVLSLLCFSFPKMHYLEIEIGLSQELKRCDILMFEKCLHYFKQLDTFVLRFKKVPVERYMQSANDLLAVFSKGIESLSELKTFEFDLLRFDYDESVFSNFIKSLFKLSKINNLCIKNLDTEMHQNSFKRVNQLFQAFPDSTELKLTSLSIHRLPLIANQKAIFFEKVKSVKSLKSLNLGIRAVQPKNNKFEILSQSLLPLQNLERLTLCLDDFAISGDLENLGENLGKLQFLKSLKIDIPNIDFIHFEDIVKFCHGISNIDELSEFNFSYGHLHPQSSLSLKPIIRNFSTMKHLHNVKLAEWAIAERKNDDVQAIIESDSRFNDLEELFLELKPFDVNTYRISHKANLLNPNPNLHTLTISAPECLDLEIVDLVELLKSLSEVASEITNLKLNLLQCTGLKADTFGDLMTAINRFTLKSLSLNLDKTNLSDDCMMSFGELLHFQKKLVCLDMGLGAFGGATPAGMLYFYKEVGRLYNLKTLKVCHTNYAFSKVAWKMVCDELSRMKELESLTLEFFGCSFVTDYSLEQLSLVLSELKLLKFFRLLPGSNSAFSDFGLRCLLSQILELKGLEEIRIDFKNLPSKISHEMKLHFMEMVDGMPAMKKNNVTFQG